MVKNTLVISCLFPALLFAQKKDLLQFEQVHGLSQNTVYSIMKDRQGFMWIATADGLNRYDGMEMKIYRPSLEEKKGGFKNRIIRTQLMEDSNHHIWFSTSSGLYNYNKQKDFFNVVYISRIKGEPRWALDPVWIDGKHFWGFNGSWGVFDYNMETGDWISYGTGTAPENTVPIYKVVTDTENNFWFTASNGLLFFNRKKKTWEHLFTDKKFIAIGAVQDQLYLATASEVCMYNIKTAVITKLAVNSKSEKALIRVFYTDRKQHIWAGDEAGNLFVREKGNSQFVYKGNINGENKTGSSYPVYSIYVDENDIIWVGADVLGLQKAKLKKQPFKLFPEQSEGRPDNRLFIHSILEVSEQTVWLGTYRKGLWEVNRSTGKAKQVAVPMTNTLFPDENSVSLLQKDSHGNTWVASYNNIYIIEKGKFDFKKIEFPLPSGSRKEIRPFAMREFNDTIYFTTALGVYRVVKNENRYKVHHFDKVGTGFFKDIFIDHQQNFWLAVENGLIRKKKINLEKPMSSGDTILFSGIGVSSFLPDTPAGLLWISTSSGLIAWHLASSTYKAFTELNGLGNSFIYGVLKNKNVLWISTNNGLSKADIKTVTGSPFPELKFTNFTQKDGLPADEFNTRAFHRGASGDLYFGTVKGAVWFNQDLIKTDTSLPVIVMTRLLVNEAEADSAIAPGFIKQLQLPYTRNNIYFEFRGIEFSNPEKITYAYRLQGWDKDWLYSGTLNQVRYNGLPPGNYRFEIKAANGSGMWTAEPYSVSVIIYPPFWKTNWFYGLVGFFAFISIVFITWFIAQRKLRKKLSALQKQRELDKERLRISREMHDDIGAGLTQITLMSESAKAKRDPAAFEQISKTSRQLVNNISEIIWSLNPETKTLGQTMAFLREQVYKQLDHSEINCTVSLPESHGQIILTNNQRRNIILIVKEIVNNAIKYSEATQLSVSAKLTGRQLEFDISDNGRGFEPAQVQRGEGLKNIKHRTEELDAVMQLRSKPGKGTHYVVTIPLTPTT